MELQRTGRTGPEGALAEDLGGTRGLVTARQGQAWRNGHKLALEGPAKPTTSRAQFTQSGSVKADSLFLIQTITASRVLLEFFHHFICILGAQRISAVSAAPNQ